jgi:agmatinase
MNFNPNDVGVANGNFFGFPNNPDSCDILLISVPWDVTTSYKPGTSNGPEAMIDASVQLDFFDFEIPNAWETSMASLSLDEDVKTWNSAMRSKADLIIKNLEAGLPLTPELLKMQEEINFYSAAVNQKVKELSVHGIERGSVVGVVGGDHSCPLGLLEALGEHHQNFGILHIDAHADLRDAYEGFEFSHASIMNNALKINSVEKLVQVAIRDVSAPEIALSKKDQRINIFSDYQLKENEFRGMLWDEQCNLIVNEFPQKVYISFDIDGLMPDLCPNTGTPVPGGLSFNQAVHLLHTLHRSGKEIIGFDLCEVSPGKTSDWDANVGARILYKLCLVARKEK